MPNMDTNHMRHGDIILVQLQAGPRLCRYIETKSNRMRLDISRNRQARLPLSRVIYETGLNAAAFAEVEEMNQQAEAVADALDLEEVWDVVCDDGDALTVEDMGELYWGEKTSVQQDVGLILHLLREDLYFVRDGAHFLPRDRDAVANIIERRQLQAQRTADAASLAASIRSGQPLDTLTSHQQELMNTVRGLVLHGDDFVRADFAKRFLESAGVKARDLQRAAFDALVKLGVMDIDEHLALEREGIVADFPEDALEEAKAADQTTLLLDSKADSKTAGIGDTGTKRDDLTELLTFTIDDASTRDRDDALSIQPVGDGAYRVGIHITDAGALIQRGSSLDAEADRRMSSLYLPERTISMLPPAISAGEGSLNPGETRAAVSLFAHLNDEGELREWSVSQSAIRSDFALSYEEADSAIEDEAHPMHTELSALNGLADALRRTRETNGALSISRDELSVKIDDSGEISVRVLPRTSPARGLIEECMVLCNSLLARYCVDNGLPAPFRSQTVPDISDIVAKVADGPLRAYMITRRLSAAIVSVKAAAHGGLGVAAYTQATSPLRRYTDLVVQRQISHHLQTGETLYDEEAVTSVAHRADLQIRQIARIENARRQHFFLKWLDTQRSASEEEGRDFICGAVTLENPNNRSATVELLDWPFRTRASLPRSVKPGDITHLRLHGVDLWRRTAQFTLAQTTDTG